MPSKGALRRRRHLVSALTVAMITSAPLLAAAPQQVPAAPAAPGPTAAEAQAPGESSPRPAPTSAQPSVAVPPAAPGQPVPPPPGRVFGSAAGMIFSPIRPERVADFELVLSRIHEALATSSDPVRRQQAAGWKAFKAIEPGPNATVLYVFVMDPAVKGADYTVSKILSEAFPAEVQELFKLYTAAFAGSQSLLNLQLIENNAAPPGPRKPLPGAPTSTPPAVPGPVTGPRPGPLSTPTK